MSSTDRPATSVVESTDVRADVVPPRAEATQEARSPVPLATGAVPGPQGRRELRRTTRQLLAIAFAVAWLACPLIEPLPAGHEQTYPLWQLPIDVAAIGTIVLAVGALWRGSRLAPRLGIAAGVMMAVETIVCPYAGHTPIGWWTWVQAGLSLLVLFTSATLRARQRS